MRFATNGNYHLIYFWWNVNSYLLDDLRLDFITVIWHREAMNLELWWILDLTDFRAHINYNLVLKASQLKRLAVHPYLSIL